MGKRTNTAVWLEKYKRWQVNEQKDGVRRTFTCSKPGKVGQRECNAKADAWLDDGIESGGKRVTQLFDEWIQSLKQTTSKAHWGQYEQYGRNWINPKIGHIKISNLNEQHLQSVIDNAYKNGKLSKKTLTNIRSCLVSFIKYCRKAKATTLIIDGLSVPKQAKVGERVILQPHDLALLFTCQNTIKYNKEQYELYVNAYRFEVATGLRPGEVIGLKKSDISGDTVHLKRSINVDKETTSGKNDNARRSFVLTPISQAILSAQSAKMAELKIESDYVFPDQYGGHIAQNIYYKHWVKFRDYIGIAKASPYELRHTFVSIVKKLPEGFLRPLVGHSKNMDTYGTYSHEVAGDMEATATLVQNAFKDIFKNVL